LFPDVQTAKRMSEAPRRLASSCASARFTQSCQLLPANGHPECPSAPSASSPDAELGLDELRLDHQDQALTTGVCPLDKEIAVDATAPGLVVEDVRRRRVLDGDRLHRREARNEWPKHLPGEFQARAERREHVEAHRLARSDRAPYSWMTASVDRCGGVIKSRMAVLHFPLPPGFKVTICDLKTPPGSWRKAAQVLLNRIQACRLVDGCVGRLEVDFE